MFDQIIESYINGQRTQMFDQFSNLSEVDKHNFVDYIKESYLSDTEKIHLLVSILKRIY